MFPIVQSVRFDRVCGVWDGSTDAAVGVWSAQVVVTVASCFIIDKAGRRSLLMIAGTGMAAMDIVLVRSAPECVCVRGVCEGVRGVCVCGGVRVCVRECVCVQVYA